MRTVIASRPVGNRMISRAHQATLQRPPSGDGLELSILGGFRLNSGGTPLPGLAPEGQRLLALLALVDRVVSRATVAGILWRDASQDHAFASLRSALSRLPPFAHRAITVTGIDLALAREVEVDLRAGRALAHRLVDPWGTPSESDLGPEAIQTLSTDCLPDWYEDWAIIEAEDWRQLRLHALDALVTRLTEAGRFADAVAAALAASRADPLRESACAALVRVHLAEGNQSEAVRAFDQYRALLKRELGIEPTPALQALISPS